jgi:microcystin-dependent protein
MNRKMFNATNQKYNDIRKAWAEFAESYVKPIEDEIAYFATLTTQYTLTLPSARRAVARFASCCRREQLGTIRGVWFAELYEAKDGYHLHALLATNLQRDTLNKCWAVASKANETHAIAIERTNLQSLATGSKLVKLSSNRSAFVKLRKGGRAGMYASKYLAKGGTQIDYDIIA